MPYISKNGKKQRQCVPKIERIFTKKKDVVTSLSIYGRWSLNSHDKTSQMYIIKAIAGGNGLEDNTKENEI